MSLCITTPLIELLEDYSRLVLEMVSASVNLSDVIGREREGFADAWPQPVYLAAFAPGIMGRTALAASAAS